MKCAALLALSAALLLAVLVGPAHGQTTGGTTTGATGPCSSDCTGPNDSCLYCSLQCGTCLADGVITDCRNVGTVHFSFDGPIPNTNAILDTLASKNVKASFYIVGMSVPGQEGVLKRIYAEGHYIGSLSYTYLHANSLNATGLAQYFVPVELGETRALIQSSVYPLTPAQVPVDHYRAPYAELNKNVLAAVKNAGYTPVLWNLDLQDTTENATTIAVTQAAALAKADPRTNTFIVTYHAGGSVSLGELPNVIDRFTAAGYKIADPWGCYLPPISSTGGTGGGQTGGLTGGAVTTSTGRGGLTGGGQHLNSTASSAPSSVMGGSSWTRVLFTIAAAFAIAAGVVRAAF